MNSLSVGPYSQLNPARINQGHATDWNKRIGDMFCDHPKGCRSWRLRGVCWPWGLGAICLMGALGLWLVPGSAIGGDALKLKLGLTAVFPSATATLV